MPLAMDLRVEQPGWLCDFAARLPARLDDAESRMQVAVSLSEQNLNHSSGGPFGALVVARDSGQVVALGVNRVEPACCSAAHAEIMALSLAQQSLGVWSLAETTFGPLQLVTSCEPCAMCLGAIPWSGVHTVLCGATKADAEAAGFDEGDRPPQWTESLEARGIEVRCRVLRGEAAAVLERYARAGHTVY